MFVCIQAYSGPAVSKYGSTCQRSSNSISSCILSTSPLFEETRVDWFIVPASTSVPEMGAAWWAAGQPWVFRGYEPDPLEVFPGVENLDRSD